MNGIEVTQMNNLLDELGELGMSPSCFGSNIIYRGENKMAKYKVGDILITKATIGKVPCGTEVKVAQVYPDSWDGMNGNNGIQYGCHKKNKDGKWGTYWYNYWEDQLEYPTKEKKVAALKKEKKNLNKRIEEIDKHIDFLENYEDEEDYVATKIHKMIENKSDKDAIREILKEMKKTKLL